MNEPLNILVHIGDDGQRWVFLFSDTAESRLDTLSALARYALDPELSISLDDAKTLGRKLFSHPERVVVIE